MSCLDCVCLTNSVFVAFLLVYVLGAPMAWYQMVQAVLYGVLAVLQLLLMFTNRELYQQYRFKVGGWVGVSTERVHWYMHAHYHHPAR